MEIINKKIVWQGKFMSAVKSLSRRTGRVRTWKPERLAQGIVVMVAVAPRRCDPRTAVPPPVGRVIELAGLVEPDESMEVAAGENLSKKQAGPPASVSLQKARFQALDRALRAYLCTD
jgi:hypothetical protein